MIRKLLMTTAISLVATGGAWSAETKPQAMAPELTEEGYLQSIGEAELASTLIGETVYTSEAADAEPIGDINDLVVGEDGTIHAVVIGVGGFLGVGEKNVAVGFDSIRWADLENGDRVAVFEASKESLESAPEFVPPESETALAPAGDPASDQTAMAPAAGTDATAPAAGTAPDATVVTPQESTETATAPAEEQPDNATATGEPQQNLVDVEAGSLSAEQLIGATVYSSDEQSIGEVGDVRLAADGGTVDAMIVDIGGFLGMGEKPVAIGFENLTIRKDESDAYYVYTDFTREELEAAPDYDEATYDDERDSMRLTMSVNQ